MDITSIQSRNANATQNSEPSDCDTENSSVNRSTPSSETSFRRMNAKFTVNRSQKVEQSSTDLPAPARSRRFDASFTAHRRSKVEPAVVAEHSEEHYQRLNTVNSSKETVQSVCRAENSSENRDVPSMEVKTK